MGEALKESMRTPFLALVFLSLVPSLCAGEIKKPQAKTYQVPYRLTNTNHVLVRVKINGKGPYNFILDTGAPDLFLSPDAGRKLGVARDKAGLATFDRFEIEGGIVLKKTKGRIENLLQLEGMNELGLAGSDLHGIIGYTLLARYRLEFDFTKHKMAWKRLDFEPPPPRGIGGAGTADGMGTARLLVKFLGLAVGKKAQPEVVLRGFLGIALEDVKDSVVVTAVLADSPAAEAGVKVGDRISRFQGKAVASAADVHQLAAKLSPHETARLTVTRGNDSHTIHIKAGKGL